MAVGLLLMDGPNDDTIATRLRSRKRKRADMEMKPVEQHTLPVLLPQPIIAPPQPPVDDVVFVQHVIAIKPIEPVKPFTEPISFQETREIEMCIAASLIPADRSMGDDEYSDECCTVCFDRAKQFVFACACPIGLCATCTLSVLEQCTTTSVDCLICRQPTALTPKICTTT